jgi:hypothetical protein
MSHNLKWLETAKFLTITYDDKNICIQKNTERYKKAKDLINNLNSSSEELLDFFFHPEKMIRKHSNNKVIIENNKVSYKSNSEIFTLPDCLVKKLVEFAYNSYPWKAFSAFLHNLSENPNPESREQLYYFLEHNKFPITEDGCFLAYKYVTEIDGHLYDAYTKEYLNDVGCIVVMDRNKCNSDRSTTCSHGLHVAAYEYASGCGIGEVIIEVKINPKDVVAVPYDYNNQKMRVCRYEVIKKGATECKNSYVSYDFIYPKKSDETNNHHKDINLMTANEIIEYVYIVTGQKINFSLKSKKSIIKKAKELLNGIQKITFDEISLTNKTAQEIKDIVFSQTGKKILFDNKSKKTIIKHAINILEDHGLKVIY